MAVNLALTPEHYEDNLHPLVQYELSALFFDCSHLPAFHYAALSLYGDNDTVSAIVMRKIEGRGWMNITFPKVLELVSYAEELALTLPIATQYTLMSAMLSIEAGVISSTMIMLAEWNFMDSTTGGGLNVNGWDYGKRRLYDKDYKPTPKTKRKLYAPSAIRRYVNLDRETIPVMRAVRKGLYQFPMAKVSKTNPLETFFETNKRRYNEINQALGADRYNSILNDNFPRKIRKQKRAVLTRSISTASSIIGFETAKAFLKGEAVIVSDGNIRLSITRARDLYSEGMLSLHINVQNLEGQSLSDICLYFEDTPMFDQLGAIALYVAAGEMEELINTGNLLRITDLGYKHPVIIKKLESPIPDNNYAELRRAQLNVMHALQENAEFTSISKHRKECQHIALMEYIRETGLLYIDAIVPAIWGRQFKVKII